ncbi:HD domain-containing protein [Sorangium sp. So ce233]|uniref:HD domain-containing protein n=1 Tax=Sorangium sp. So ce233 TaxID=3133290 RepID=UPI003F628296
MPSAKLRLPKRLEETLSHTPSLHGAILVSLNEFEPWITDNKLPFFPEYTDHGPDHINDVFVTAEALIRDEAWPHVTPEDVAVLVLGILLHDCAMHLSEEGFIALLQKKEWATPISLIDSTPWPRLWGDFLREAARFDGKKLKKLFGDTEPAKPPPLNALAMNKRDRLLIGEFLRRHHPRLAHEIALKGVPGPTTTPLKFQNIDVKLADLGGLVARSHGMPLRTAADLLPSDERRETRNVHVPFLMSVLRIADYLQIHAERAPSKLLQVRSLQSPVSVGEWRKHDAIETIHNRHDDPDALYVKALPKDGATYVGLKRLFSSIQDELDDVWAVLGEVYGRVNDLSDFGIMIRRLRSNLDDEKSFAKTVNYVPGQAEYQAAGADLLKLLVGPLYGNQPEIGIRELLQNALDACRELDDYLKQHTCIKPKPVEQEADVVISLTEDDDGTFWLMVSDLGIGMTSEVIKEYFLKAGASFRNSDAWRKQHTDGHGKSRVLRSGRFGVGALAAFLLGDTIELSTRHISMPRGIEFVAGIDDEVIELRYTDRPVGTTIRAKIAPEQAESLTSPDDWDWYYLDAPTVLRTIQIRARESIGIVKQETIPQCMAPLGPEWRRIQFPGYDDIQWSYWGRYIASIGTKQYYVSGSRFLCNGIIVAHNAATETLRAHLGDPGDDFVHFSPPSISVFDSDGRLPLNLQRNELNSRPSFIDELYDDISRDFIAYLLVNAPESPIDNLSEIIRYPGARLGFGITKWIPIWTTSRGWSFFDVWHIGAIGVASILVASHSRNADRCAQAGNGSTIFFNSNSRDLYNNWFRAMLGQQATRLGPLGPLCTASRRILVPRASYKVLRRPGIVSKHLWSRSVEEWSNKSWIIMRVGDCPTGLSTLQSIAENAPSGDTDTVAEWYLRPSEFPAFEPSRIARIWAEAIKGPTIPFKIDERRRVLAHAYEKLNSYIVAHEQLLKPGKVKLPDFDDDDQITNISGDEENND